MAGNSQWKISTATSLMYTKRRQSKRSTGATSMRAQSWIARLLHQNYGKARLTPNAKSTVLCARNGKEKTSSTTLPSRGCHQIHALNQPANPVSRMEQISKVETQRGWKKKNKRSPANLKSSVPLTKSNLAVYLLESTLNRCSKGTSSFSLRSISCVKK